MMVVTSVTLESERLKQENGKFQASLDYMESLRQA